MNFYKEINEQTKAKNILKESKLQEAKSNYPDFCQGLCYKVAETGSYSSIAAIGTLDPRRANAHTYSRNIMKKGFAQGSRYAFFLNEKDAQDAAKTWPNMDHSARPYIAMSGEKLIRVDEGKPNDIPVYAWIGYVEEWAATKPLSKVISDRLAAALKFDNTTFPINPFQNSDEGLKARAAKDTAAADKKANTLKQFEDELFSAYPNATKTVASSKIIYNIPVSGYKHIKNIPISIDTSRADLHFDGSYGTTKEIDLNIDNDIINELCHMNNREVADLFDEIFPQYAGYNTHVSFDLYDISETKKLLARSPSIRDLNSDKVNYSNIKKILDKDRISDIASAHEKAAQTVEDKLKEFFAKTSLDLSED